MLTSFNFLIGKIQVFTLEKSQLEVFNYHLNLDTEIQFSIFFTNFVYTFPYLKNLARSFSEISFI